MFIDLQQVCLFKEGFLGRAGFRKGRRAGGKKMGGRAGGRAGEKIGKGTKWAYCKHWTGFWTGFWTGLWTFTLIFYIFRMFVAFSHVFSSPGDSTVKKIVTNKMHYSHYIVAAGNAVKSSGE